MKVAILSGVLVAVVVGSLLVFFGFPGGRDVDVAPLELADMPVAYPISNEVNTSQESFGDGGTIAAFPELIEIVSRSSVASATVVEDPVRAGGPTSIGPASNEASEEEGDDGSSPAQGEPEEKDVVGEKIYTSYVVRDKPLVLEGDDVLEIIRAHYVFRNNIELKDDARLVIRDSLIEHQKDYAFQYSLEATGNSEVVIQDSEIGNQCTGSLNWNFHGSSTMTSWNVSQKDCNIWHLFTDDAVAMVRNAVFNGTFCDRARGDIGDAEEMEIELCFPEGSMVDEVLPMDIDEFSFPNENDENVTFGLKIADSTMDGWGISVLPESDITIRDTPAVTVGVIVGLPWDDETVVLEDLGSRFYEDKTWQIVDSRLRLVNVTTYGWEPNAFHNNTLVIRNSDYSGSSVNGGSAEYVIEDSAAGLIRAHENVRMMVRNSTIEGDVIAAGDSVINLVNTTVRGKIVKEDNGRVFVKVTAR